MTKRGTLAALAGAILTTALLAASPTTTRAAAPHVLLVGTYHGIAGGYTSIQAAVNAAKPGDWILVGPGGPEFIARLCYGRLGGRVVVIGRRDTELPLCHVEDAARAVVAADSLKWRRAEARTPRRSGRRWRSCRRRCGK